MLIYNSPGPKQPFFQLDTKADPDKDEKETREKTAGLIKKIAELQEKLYAENRQSILIIFQGLDGSGKDSVTKRVIGPLNPQGVEVTSFKAPEPSELTHDFLWRIHKRTPVRGKIGIFNRSHYEDVLVVRVKKLVGEEVWMERFSHINNFEKLLAGNGTRVLKFYLHISKKEQMERFDERKNTPEKNWKYNPADQEVQELWDEYMKAYLDVFDKCSTPYAPWHIIPADNKWYRDHCIAKTILKALEEMNPQYPVKSLI